jgi:hypothetical protein
MNLVVIAYDTKRVRIIAQMTTIQDTAHIFFSVQEGVSLIKKERR